MSDSYRLRTSSSCSGIKGGYIPGYQREDTNCKARCDEHEWCRGYRISNSFVYRNQYSCRLLTPDRQDGMSGWTLLDEGNWLEPELWKESNALPYKCFEKNVAGKLYFGLSWVC